MHKEIKKLLENMKKTLILLLSAIMLLAVAGCNYLPEDEGISQSDDPLRVSVPSKGTITDEFGYMVSYDNEISIENMKFSDFEIFDNPMIAAPNTMTAHSYYMGILDVQKKVENLYLRNNNGFVYGIVKIKNSLTEETEYLFMHFKIEARSTSALVDAMALKKLFNEEDFSNIKKRKSTLKDVREIDSLTLMDIGDDIGKTYHKCKNGKVVEIEYKIIGDPFWGEEHRVRKIRTYDDPMNFVKNLLPADFEVIT